MSKLLTPEEREKIWSSHSEKSFYAALLWIKRSADRMRRYEETLQAREAEIERLRGGLYALAHKPWCDEQNPGQHCFVKLHMASGVVCLGPEDHEEIKEWCRGE